MEPRRKTCLFFLYDLAGKGADDLIKSVEELKRQTLSDGQEHSVRVRFFGIREGLLSSASLYQWIRPSYSQCKLNSRA